MAESRPDTPLAPALRIALQLAVVGGFAAFVAYFSNAPAVRLRGDDEAVVKLSFSHAAQLLQPCRERSEAELAKLAPNMRNRLDCPRERAPIRVELDLDGTTVHRITLPPAGLHRDGAATVYRRSNVAAGRHHVAARLSDQASGDMNHAHEATIDLAPGQVLLIDFLPASGGFVFTRG